MAKSKADIGTRTQWGQNVESVEIVDKNKSRLPQEEKSLINTGKRTAREISAGKQHIHKFFVPMEEQKIVDMWKNYIPRRFSPILWTSPAPIVINRSPAVQFSKRKFSISSKERK